MNAAYVHIALNHIPVIGMIIGFGLLIIGQIAKKDTLVKASMGMFVVFALFSIPVYLTGKPAAKLIADQPGFSAAAVHAHAEVAEYALIGAIILGIITLITLIVWQIRWKRPGGLIVLIVVVGFVISGLMGWTAYKGGLVRRPDLRKPQVPQLYRGEPQNK